MAKAQMSILVAALACAALGFSGLMRRGANDLGGSPGGRKAATQPAVADRVTALGRIEPEGGVIAVAGPTGGRVATLEAREGQDVRKGDVLATLEGRAGLLAERAHIQAQLREADARIDAEDRYRAAIEAEEAVERRRVVELEALELAAQDAKLGLLRENLKTSTRGLARLEGLRSSAAVSPQELDQARLLVRRDQEELHAGEALLAKLRKAHEINLKALDAQATKAAAASARLRGAIPRESLAKGIDLVDAKLAEAEVRAPNDGRILKVIARPGEATGARPILQLGDTRAMAVVAEVYETDRGRVRPGLRAEVTSPALPEGHSPLRGTVERIGWTVAKNDVLGLDPSADAYARVVEVRIRLDPEDSKAVEHLTNLQVEVRIDAGARDGAQVAESR